MLSVCSCLQCTLFTLKYSIFAVAPKVAFKLTTLALTFNMRVDDESFLQNRTFEQFDHNQDGAVTFVEFMSELARMGENNLQEIIKQAQNSSES